MITIQETMQKLADEFNPYKRENRSRPKTQFSGVSDPTLGWGPEFTNLRLKSGKGMEDYGAKMRRETTQFAVDHPPGTDIEQEKADEMRGSGDPAAWAAQAARAGTARLRRTGATPRTGMGTRTGPGTGTGAVPGAGTTGTSTSPKISQDKTVQILNKDKQTYPQTLPDDDETSWHPETLPAGEAMSRQPETPMPVHQQLVQSFLQQLDDYNPEVLTRRRGIAQKIKEQTAAPESIPQELVRRHLRQFTLYDPKTPGMWRDRPEQIPDIR